MNPRSRNANFDRTIGLCSAKTGKARLCCGDRCTNGKMPGRALEPDVLFPCFVGSLALNNIRRGDGRDKAGNRWEVEIACRRRTVRFPTTAHNHLTTVFDLRRSEICYSDIEDAGIQTIHAFRKLLRGGNERETFNDDDVLLLRTILDHTVLCNTYISQSFQLGPFHETRPRFTSHEEPTRVLSYDHLLSGLGYCPGCFAKTESIMCL